jgi:hypothetical protein
MVLPVSLQKERKTSMRETRMTPSEYCKKWIPHLYGHEPGEYGYRKACIIELACITDFETSSIQNWGQDLNNLSKRSRSLVERVLAQQDLLNEADARIRPFVSRPHLR